MIYTVENITDETIKITLSGDTSYQTIEIPAHTSVPIQKPDGYILYGDITSIVVTKN
jgi:hypothetical protein